MSGFFGSGNSIVCCRYELLESYFSRGLEAHIRHQYNQSKATTEVSFDRLNLSTFDHGQRFVLGTTPALLNKFTIDPFKFIGNSSWIFSAFLQEETRLLPFLPLC